MKIDLPYLDRFIPVTIPDRNLLAIAEPSNVPYAGDHAAILTRAMGNPMTPDGRAAGRGFGEFMAGARSALVIVNDATRPTPTERMLDALLPSLGGIDLTVLVATGAHRAPTDAEYKQILGRHHDTLRARCCAHDARDESLLVDLGKTRNGTRIVLNRLLFEKDRILVTGSVEPHYFAGYTGGRKAFLPGVAAYRTIEANHKLAMGKGSASLSLVGNPVHEDMVDALPLINAPVFSLMAVLDREQGLAAATSGDIRGAFMAAVDVARKIFAVSVPSRAEVVVAVAKFPMDIDLYQSQKAIENGSLALADGGTLFLVSSCRDGIGDRTFADLLTRASSPGKVLELIGTGYKLGYHKAAKMAALASRARIMAKTELDGGQLRRLFIEPVSDLAASVQDAIAATTRASGRDAKVLVLPDGSVTIPVPAR